MANACAYLVGSGMPLHSVCDYTAVRGKVAIVGRVGGADMTFGINALLEKNIDLYTIVDCGKNYSSAINLLANRTVEVGSLYDRIVAFENAPEVFETLASPSYENPLKTLIKIA